MSERPPQPVAALGYVPALDGLRALAVTAVLFFHADAPFASGGFLGVSVFFTISGFLVATLLLDEHASTGTIDLRSFASRRARRLLPAAWAGLALVIVAVPFWNDAQVRRLTGDLFAALANMTNWRAATGETSYQDLFATSPSPLAHFWSLAIEMQFYVALPIVASVTLRHGGVRRFAAAIAALFIASVAATALTDDFDLAYNGTHTRAAEFLMGVGLAIALVRVRARNDRVSSRLTAVTGVAAVCGLALLVGAATVRSGWLIDGGLVGVAALSCAVIVAALGTGPVAALLSQRSLVAVGKISYGIYLFHWPIFLVLSPERTGLHDIPLFAIRLVATAAVTVASARLLEGPIRRGQRLTTPRTVRATVGAAAAVLVITTTAIPASARDDTSLLLEDGEAGLVRFGEQPDDERAAPSSVAAASHPPPSAPREPDTGPQPIARSAAVDAPPPSVALPTEPRRVLVVGSDVAALDVISELAAEGLGQPIEVIDATRPDCPFAEAVEMKLVDRVVDTSECESLTDTMTHALVSGGAPELVVVAAGEVDSGVVRRADEIGFPTDDMLREIDERSQATYAAVDDLVAPFSDAGVPVVMSWWGNARLFDLELGRIDARRTSVVGFARDADQLRRIVSRELDDGGPPEQHTRVLVLGDSTSLVLARALHDADDRLNVLWAGDNGCPIVRAVALHGDRGLRSRPIDCPDYRVKLPPILQDFDPQVVIAMPGTIALASLTFAGDDGVSPPGSERWLSRHDTEFGELLEVIRPDGPVDGPSILVPDTPTVEVGPFSTDEMAAPERLSAVNAQIQRWAANNDRVEVLDYAGPLMRYEADFGSIRPDNVHPEIVELIDIARRDFVEAVIAAALDAS